MTINEVLNEVDNIAKNNAVDREQKIKWLDRLDKTIFNDLIQYKELLRTNVKKDITMADSYCKIDKKHI